MFSCKGLCQTSLKHIVGDVLLRYNSGQKRCSVCSVYIKWRGVKCPCCNTILHTRPRHSKDKIKYYESDDVKWL